MFDKQLKIGICLPSRGLVFTEVLEWIEHQRGSFDIEVFYSHNLPIPNCHEVTAEAAFNKGKELFLFIEEDTVPPDFALPKLIETNADIACIDYGFNGGHNTVVKSSRTDEILFCGMGCTLVKRQVLEKMVRPWFRSDKAFMLNSLQWMDVDPNKVYGHHDIYFGFKARELGFKIIQVEGECRHLQLIELGNKELNSGCHVIGEKDRIIESAKIKIDIQ